jgi:hypothetical protein
MNEKSLLGWSRALLLCLLAAVPSQVQGAIESPDRIRALCDHLGSLQHPLQYSVQLETRVVLATDQPGVEGTATRVFASWVEAVLAGVPPEEGDVWSFVLGDVPSRASDARGGYQPGRRSVDHAQSADAWLSAFRSSEGFVQASLRREGLSLTYRKSTDPNKPEEVTATVRAAERPGHFYGPRIVVSPLNTESYYFDLLRAGDWEEVRVSPWTTLRMESPPDSGNCLTLCYLEEEQLPRVALDLLVADPEGTDMRYVLTFYKRSNVHAEASNTLRAYEVLRIDSLAFEGKILIERVIVYDARSLSDSEADEVLTLPVQWSERTELRDARSSSATRVYGPDVTAWPPELLELMRPW